MENAPPAEEFNPAPPEPEKMTRREFLKKLGMGAIGVAAVGLAGERFLNYAERENRQDDTEELIENAQEAGLEENEDIETKFAQIQKQAEYIGDTLDLPRRNLPDANLGDWMDQIKEDEQEPVRDVNQTQEEYTAALKEWHEFYDDIHETRRDFLTLVRQVSHGDLTLEQKQALFLRPKAQPGQVKIIGAESVGGSNSGIEQRTRDMLPPNFLNCTHTIDFREKIGTFGQAGMDKQSDNRRGIKIHDVIESDWKELNPAAQALLAHEVAHNADWASNPNLSNAQRINLYSLILQRLRAEDRYDSNYVETDKQLDRDPREWNDTAHIYDGSAEYWSVICEVYFTGYQRDWPKDSGEPKLPEGDQRAIELLLARTDPKWLHQHCLEYPKAHKKP